MTFLERYQNESTWQGKVLVMEIFHLAMSAQNPNWTVSKTAKSFDVSVALASENLKLANSLHTDIHLNKIQFRQDALVRLKRTQR